MRTWGIQFSVAAAGLSMMSGCSITVAGGSPSDHRLGGAKMGWAEVLDRHPDPKIVTDPALVASIKATGLPWRVRDTASGIEMLLVPPGSFVMGMSPADMDAMDDERPAHDVILTKPFYLGRTEVTQGQWTAVMGYNQSYFQEANFKIQTGPTHDAIIAALIEAGYTRSEAEAKAGIGELKEVDAALWPVETVSPNDLVAYLRKTGLRLPTEAEWEFACRAGVREPRYGVLDEIAWYSDNSQHKTHAVGQKKANALGFQDMIGNVWEWVGDWYSADYYAACENGATDPTGPSPSDFWVARGGSWDHVEKNCRSSFRQNHYVPDPRITDFGFRVARKPE